MNRSTSDTISLRPAVASPPRPTRGDPLIGLTLSGYVVTRPLCSGGMGVVYEARSPASGRHAAVKVIRPEYREDDALAGRFHGEISSISAIRHPNVVEILSVGVLPDGGEYMVMEFIEGETLGELILRSAPLGTRLALQVCEEVLRGLAAIHLLGLVHRDLKPGNVLLCGGTLPSQPLTVKLCDFGLARLCEARPRQGSERISIPGEAVSTVAGTPEYISPEQASGQPVDGQADLYSLGVMLFEMLTGRLPFRAATGVGLMKMHCHSRPPRVRSVVESVPWEIDAFVDLLLEKEPHLRPCGAESTVEIVRCLRDALPGSHLLPMDPPSLRDEGFSDALTTPAVTALGTSPGAQ
jgi:eukaryotic-like serine/threonine-protein kinase